MEKTARKPSVDPVQERLRQNKANWNKEVSAFVNDLIHFKKMMNGWPSKFFKERSRITSPVPADPATIIGSLAGDFQEIVNKGNGVIQEQLDYSKNRRQKQPKAPAPTGPSPEGAPATPAAPEAPKVDLNQQLGKGLAASEKQAELIKLAFVLEDKYSLESQASNPFSRFITKLFNPRLGFGEGARIRRLRMAMLDNCVLTYKELKKLQKEIVRSSKESVTTSHNLMTQIWGYWNAVNRLFGTYKMMRPSDVVKNTGGPIGAESGSKREKDVLPRVAPEGEHFEQAKLALGILKDFKDNSSSIGVFPRPAFLELSSLIETLLAIPEHLRVSALQSSYGELLSLYQKALLEVNVEKQTSGQNFAQIVSQLKTKAPVAKQAQKWLGKVRHQILPGATSSQRLEAYRLIDQVKKDLDQVMDLLEDGFDQERLVPALSQIGQEISGLRMIIRSLHLVEKPVPTQKGKQEPGFWDRLNKIEDLM